MTLSQLTAWATDKSRFQSLDGYSSFCEEFLTFIFDGLQAVIVSKNENHYRFLQYREEGNYNITRPINSRLMLSIDSFSSAKRDFNHSIRHIREIREDPKARHQLNTFTYTCQQAIGAALDALPASRANTARKINGDLFEQYVRILLQDIGVTVCDGVVPVPVIVDGKEVCRMNYQHDLIVKNGDDVLAIGSVKTTSKDRLDKIFIDKFLYNRLTNDAIPHFAVFLHDVQRKGKEPNYGVNTTFLAGHFKGYTVKLNPLDGVYYCDLRPVMATDDILREQIRTFDCLLVEDIWKLIE